MGDSREGGEEGGEEERESKSYAADRHRTWPVGQATSISEACDICAIHAHEGVGPGVLEMRHGSAGVN